LYVKLVWPLIKIFYHANNDDIDDNDDDNNMLKILKSFFGARKKAHWQFRKD